MPSVASRTASVWEPTAEARRSDTGARGATPSASHGRRPARSAPATSVIGAAATGAISVGGADRVGRPWRRRTSVGGAWRRSGPLVVADFGAWLVADGPSRLGEAPDEVDVLGARSRSSKQPSSSADRRTTRAALGTKLTLDPGRTVAARCEVEGERARRSGPTTLGRPERATRGAHAATHGSAKCATSSSSQPDAARSPSRRRPQAAW